MWNWACRLIGDWLARYLTRPSGSKPVLHSGDSVAALHAALRPGDVVLVEGDTRISTAIKYLTQSTWSHAALCVGREETSGAGTGGTPLLLEADVVEGVIIVPLSKYRGFRLRICRPVGLSEDEVERVVEAARSRLGHRYDLKNVFDLARYLIPVPPVPTRWRRRMLALGSGDPTRAICSSLIAAAFQQVRYPILPDISRAMGVECADCVTEVLHIRHHSLFAPRDFDLSPYFEVVKPGLRDFDHRKVVWDAVSPVAGPVSSTPRGVPRARAG